MPIRSDGCNGPLSAVKPGRDRVIVAVASGATSAARAAFAGRGGVPTFTIAIPGQSFAVEAQIFDQSPEKVFVESVQITPSDGKNWNIRGEDAHREIEGGNEAQWRFSATVPEEAALTRPYYSRPNEEQPYYDIQDGRYRNLPVAPYPLSVDARLVYRGAQFEVAQVVQTAERIPGIGVEHNPLIVAPAISVSVSPPAGAVPIGSKSFDFTCLIHSNVKGPAEGVLRLRLPPGWQANPSESHFAFARDGEDQAVVFSVSPDQVKPADYTITAVAEYKGRLYTEGYHLAGYAGLRPYPFYRRCSPSARKSWSQCPHSRRERHYAQ